MDVGKRITELCKEANLTGNQLAKKAGVGQSTISNYMLGKMSPTVDTLVSICNALGVSLMEFFADDINDIPVHVRQLVEVVTELTPEERALLTEFLVVITKSRKEFSDNEGTDINKSNNVIPSVEQVAAHLEGEYGIYNEDIAAHIVKNMKETISEFAEGKGIDKRRR